MYMQLNIKNSFIILFVLAFIYLGYIIISTKEHYDLDVDLKDIINYAVLAVEMGGYAVVKIYDENKDKLQIRSKGETDEGKAELLTKADLVSNHLMLGHLRRFPLLKVFTEEKTEHFTDDQVEEYKNDNYKIWLAMKPALDKLPSKHINLNRVTVWVDPLDATQEFTEGLTEYVTVMACIAIDGQSYFGVIYRPFYNQTIMGLVDYGLIDGSGSRISISKKADNLSSTKKIFVSRSHAGKVEELVNKTFSHGDYIVEPAGGSGYKTLRLLQGGTTEIYLHTTAIKKWDVCAGDALIRAAGGDLIDFNGLHLDYSSGARFLHRDGILMARKNPFLVLAKLKPNLPKL